jgi:tetratricopeptide (TPR) repeat protein
MKYLLIPLIALVISLPARADYQSLVTEGDTFDVKGSNNEALKYYLPAEKLEPNHADLLIKISRQYALRMADLPNDSQKIASGRTALSYAERAVALAPNLCDSHLSVAICLGKLSPYVSSRESVEYSRRIKTETDTAIKIDPKNDYAWHLLGRWNQALANIGGTTRILAKIIYGGLPAASNAEAVRCLKKAMALNPNRLVHVIELGRTYAMMGRNEEAKKLILQGLAMPNREKDDPETKERGKKTLASIS